MEMNNYNPEVPKIDFQDTKTKQVSGAVCVSSPDQIRLGLLEEKLTNDEYGNITIVQQCDTQLVFTPEVARSLINMLEENLNSHSL